jgi:hypothetical protein
MPTLPPDAIDELNEYFAFIEAYGQIYDLRHKKFRKLHEFKLEFLPRTVRVIRASDDEHEHKYERLADKWLKSSRRRTHRDITFDPGAPPVTPDNKLNLWQGWGCVPVKGDVNLFLELVSRMCNCDPDKMRYVIQWFAYPIQHPGAKLYTSIILYSSVQGNGKSTLVKSIAQLYGGAAAIITSDHFKSQFNSWAAYKSFVIGDEIVIEGRWGASQRLKGYITEDTVSINEKFQPLITLPNKMNLALMSNNETPVKLEDADRRFYVLETSARKDGPFFELYYDWYDNQGGKAALLHYLMCEVDLAGFRPTEPAPMTADKQEMIDLGRDPVEQLVAGMIDDPGLDRDLFHVEELVHRTQSNCTAVGRALKRLNRPWRQLELNVQDPFTSKPRIRRLRFYAMRKAEQWVKASTEEWRRYAETSLHPSRAHTSKLTLAVNNDGTPQVAAAQEVPSG